MPLPCTFGVVFNKGRGPARAGFLEPGRIALGAHSWGGFGEGSAVGPRPIIKG